jgi:hypothetical protein
LVIGFVYIERGGLRETVYAETLFTHGMFAFAETPYASAVCSFASGVFLMHGNPLVKTLRHNTYMFIYIGALCSRRTLI